MKMMKPFAATLMAVLLAVSPVGAKEPVRIDASSDAAAEASWKAMMDAAAPGEQRQLQFALLQINLAGVKSAREAASDPALQSMGITRIKDKVAGMTADEIIALGKRVTTIEKVDSARD